MSRRDYKKVKLAPHQIQAEEYKNYLGGGAETWSRRGRFQRELLRSLGLVQGHSLLDVGCGPIRAGVHFIEFLDPGNYCGVDFNPSFVESANRLIESGPLTSKSPQIFLIDEFEVGRLGRKFDYLLCFSVLNHCTDSERHLFFDRIKCAMHQDSRLVVTHGDWFDAERYDVAGLLQHPTINNESQLPPHLKLADWGFGDVGDRLPILQFGLRPPDRTG